MYLAVFYLLIRLSRAQHSLDTVQEKTDNTQIEAVYSQGTQHGDNSAVIGRGRTEQLTVYDPLTRSQHSPDTVQEKVNNTQIEIVYNQYIQNGNNSAVTGGRGTERLTVYGPMMTIKKNFKKNTFGLNVGSDIISSASTDKIDFVQSSASILDTRTYVNGSYSRKITNRALSVHGNIGVSIESDYFSVGWKVGVSKQTKMSDYYVYFQAYNDDLRWGRLSSLGRPVKLIYPEELRYKEWYDEYRRNSYNVKLGYTRVLNKRNRLGLFSDVVYQTGLLATPFHRIYFSDNTEGVEKLPNERVKVALQARLNTFVHGNVIVKNSINTYIDTFGIMSFAFGNETVIKIYPFLKLCPAIRFYIQKASPYFKEYGNHNSKDTFYTSDHDYANINTYNVGMGIKYTPLNYLNKKIQFKIYTFRYSYLLRSDNLHAHICSLSFGITYRGKHKK